MNISDRIFRTFNDAQQGIVEEIERGKARVGEFDIESLTRALVKQVDDVYVIRTGGKSFWMIAENFAV